MQFGNFRPLVWLGQSTDTSPICSHYKDLRDAPFLTSLGCAIRRPSLSTTHFNARLRHTMGFDGPLMLDSGGFVLSKDEHPHWTVRKLRNLVEKIDADVFVSLDIPPSLRDTAATRERKIIQSAKNFRALFNRFPRKTIMPVIHGRTSEEIALSIRKISDINQKPKWVGLGGVVPLLQHRRATGLKIEPEIFIANALSLVREAFPKSIIHVFGAGGTRTFPAVVALGANSADSIGWRQAAGFGSIFLPMKSQRTVVWKKSGRPPRKLLDASDLKQVNECRCPICRPLNLEQRLLAFERNFHFRAIHNAWTSVNQPRFWPRSIAVLRETIGNGQLGSAWAKAIAFQAGKTPR